MRAIPHPTSMHQLRVHLLRYRSLTSHRGEVITFQNETFNYGNFEENKEIMLKGKNDVVPNVSTAE